MNVLYSVVMQNRTPVPIESVVKLTEEQLQFVKDAIVAITRTKTMKGAAKQLGISPETLSRKVKTYPQIMAQVHELEDMTVELARGRLRSNAEVGANKLISLMKDAKSETVQLGATTEILDRAGIVKPQTQNNIQVNVLTQLNKDKDSFDL